MKSIKLLTIASLICMSFSLMALSAKEVRHTVTFRGNFNAETSLVNGRYQHDVNLVARGVDWILEATGVHLNKGTDVTGSKRIAAIKIDITTLEESLGGEIDAKYVPMIIEADHFDCRLTSMLIDVMIKYLPIRSYRQSGKCRGTTGTKLKSSFFGYFEILTRTDKKHQPNLIYRNQGHHQSPFLRGHAFYQKDNGVWVKFLAWGNPSPYGTHGSPMRASRHEIARFLNTPCDSTFTPGLGWQSCDKDTIVTIEELNY